MLGRFYIRRLPLLVALIIGCDRIDPLDPAVQARFGAGAGSTLQTPSPTSAVAVSGSRIDVSWLDNSSHETGFEVHRSTAGLGGPFALRVSTGAGVTGYSDLGLTPSTEYCYKVRAFRTRGGRTSYSAFSTPGCATTPAPPGLPNAPSWTDAIPAGSSYVIVSWSDNATNEDGFRVERSLDGGFSWVSAGTSGAASGYSPSFTDGGRTSEAQVCYRVIAFNAQGDSPPSNRDCATPPAGPSGLRAAAVEPEFQLTWMDNSGLEDGYDVMLLGAHGPYEVIASLPPNSTSFRAGGCEAPCSGFAVAAVKDGGYSDLAIVDARSP